MGRESWLLIHEGSLGTQGSWGEVQDTIEWMKKVQERFLGIFADRSKLSKTTIKKNWSRKDWWLDSDECLKNGLVDKVL
jgi:ATP-dependent protease ClpP protease subunit